MAAWPVPTLDGKPPIVIAHRGASGYRPEHTLEAYALAIEMGADVIEPDLVFTRDGALVVRHDRYLSSSTDVADHPEFAWRRRANDDPADTPREDWWVEDFTLAELKTLRARQPREGRSKEYDRLCEIPTFGEVLALAAAMAEETGRPVGVYPETKHPGFFASKGYDFVAPLLTALEGFDAGPVFIQSFEPEILKRLKGKTDAKIVQLVHEASPGAGPNIPLAEIAEYADGVGPAKELILKQASLADVPTEVTNLVRRAHELGLFVHAWTFRDDEPNPSVIIRVYGDECAFKVIGGASACEEAAPAIIERVVAEQEFFRFFAQAVDGVFTDFPDTAIRARESMSGMTGQAITQGKSPAQAKGE